MTGKMYRILAVAVLFTVAGDIELHAANYSLDEVVVEGARDIYAGSYLSERTGIGMVQGKNTMEMPFNTMTLTEKTIKDFAMPNNDEVMDLLSFSPSIRKTTSRDLVAMRGKQVSASQMTLNGIPGMYGNFSMGTNFIDSVDIISGPAINYTGSATENVVGGIVGFHTKKALNTPTRDINISFMNGDHFKENLDWGQRFGKDGTWGVRVNALYADGDLAVHGESLHQKNIFVNIDHRTETSTSNLFVGYAYSKHNGGNGMFQTIASNPSLSALQGLPYIPDAPDGKYNTLPSWAYREKKVKLFTFNHMQKLNEHWSAFINTGIMSQDVPMSIDGSSMAAIFIEHFQNGIYDGKFNRSLSASANGKTQRYLGAGLTSNYDFGFMKNEFLIALDRNAAVNHSALSSKTVTLTPGDLYGNNDWPYQSFTQPGTYMSSKYATKGVTVLDTMKFLDDKLIFSAGIHHHSYQARSYDKMGKLTKNETYDGNSPTYGVLYRFNDRVSAYVNHAETFLGGATVGKGFANEGELLSPAKTKSNEVGVKVKSGNFLHTLAFYRSKEPSGGVDENNYYGYVGSTKYDGVEFSTAGSIGDKLDIMASLSYSRWIWQNNAIPGWNGTLADGIPEWNTNLALAYHVNNQLDILGRMSYIGSSGIGTDANGQKHYNIPAYIRFDLGAKYKTKIADTPVTFSAMCYNLTNKKGWFTADRGNQLYTADPRTFVISADMSF